MTDYSPITKDHNWFTGAKKIFQFKIDTTDDITGWSLVWELRKSPTEDTFMIHKTETDGLQVDNPTKTVTLTVNAADTDDLEPGEYSHGLKRDTAGSETILSQGEAVLQQAASH